MTTYPELDTFNAFDPSTGLIHKAVKVQRKGVFYHLGAVCGSGWRRRCPRQELWTRKRLNCLGCIAEQRVDAVSSQYINSNFVRLLDEGRTQDAEAEGTAFIRKMLREESFAREIIEPVLLTDEEIDRDD